MKMTQKIRIKTKIKGKRTYKLTMKMTRRHFNTIGELGFYEINCYLKCLIFLVENLDNY